jgi:hypothetical protein
MKKRVYDHTWSASTNVASKLMTWCGNKEARHSVGAIHVEAKRTGGGTAMLTILPISET